MTYTEPTIADLKARYPAFTGVADATLAYWLTDADRFVDESWREDDYIPAKLAAAAHGMAMEGLGTGNATSTIPQGVTSFKSGTFSASIDSSQASARGWASTRYGQEFLALMRRNFGGPRSIVAGTDDCYCYGR